MSTTADPREDSGRWLASRSGRRDTGVASSLPGWSFWSPRLRAVQGRGVGLLQQPHAARHAVPSGGESAAARLPRAGRRSGSDRVRDLARVDHRARVRARIEPALARVAPLPHVVSVVSPYSAHGAHQIAADRTVAFATVTFDEQARSLPVAAINRVIATAAVARATSSLQVALGGQAIEHAEKPSLGSATAIGLLAAIVILLITFGSFIAMGLPILTALLGLGVGISLAGLGSHIIQIPDFATQLAAMIGLGVGHRLRAVHRHPLPGKPTARR